MKKQIEEIGFEDVEFISHPKENVWYVGYKVKVKRGIRGKAKGFVNEVLIVGMNSQKFYAWANRHHIIVKCDCPGNEVEWAWDFINAICPNTDPDEAW